MVIIKKATLNKFGAKHPLAARPLNRWYNRVRAADWSTLNEMKADFKSVDYVGNYRYVFNIKGNKFRLIAMIFFDVRTAYIRFVGTHAEYDKIDAKTI